MEKVQISNPQGYTAEVYHHGAHITSWRDPQGRDLIFLSKKAVFAPPKAIRGGVPLCFPQFGMMGPMSQQHGFARNSSFSVEESSDSSVSMVLKYDGKEHATYPHPFELRVKVQLVDNMLIQDLKVTNTGTSPMEFTGALHTYLRVVSAPTACVKGLQNVAYLDNLAAQKKETDTSEAVVFAGEVDRVYLAAPPVITVEDPEGGGCFEVTKSSSLPDAVVWNPWIAKAQSMADFGHEEYKEMICVEAALAGSGATTLQPGQAWEASQNLTYKKK